MDTSNETMTIRRIDPRICKDPISIIRMKNKDGDFLYTEEECLRLLAVFLDRAKLLAQQEKSEGETRTGLLVSSKAVSFYKASDRGRSRLLPSQSYDCRQGNRRHCIEETWGCGMSCVNGYGGEGLEDFTTGFNHRFCLRRPPAQRDYFLKEIKMNALVIGNTQTSIESDVPYLPEGNFYCGNGKSVSWIALQDLAEHLGNYRCMDYVRAAFVEILESLDMSSGDKAYYKELAGLAAIGTQE